MKRLECQSIISKVKHIIIADLYKFNTNSLSCYWSFRTKFFARFEQNFLNKSVIVRWSSINLFFAFGEMSDERYLFSARPNCLNVFLKFFHKVRLFLFWNYILNYVSHFFIKFFITIQSDWFKCFVQFVSCASLFCNFSIKVFINVLFNSDCYTRSHGSNYTVASGDKITIFNEIIVFRKKDSSQGLFVDIS